MRNGILVLAALLLGGALWGGAIREEGGETVITLKVPSLPNAAFTDASTRSDVAVHEAFRRDFPELFRRKYRKRYQAEPQKYGKFRWKRVRIELEAASGIQVEGVENDLLAIAGGMAPDILSINFRKSDNYIRNHFLYPLDEYYRTLSREEFRELVPEKLVPVIARRGDDGRQHCWLVPTGALLGRVLLYRKSLFDERRIAYPDAAWTWRELYQACRELTDPARGVYGLVMGQGSAEAWYWQTFLWSAGGDSTAYDPATGEWRCAFDSEAAVEALDFYTRLCSERWTDRRGRIRRGYVLKDPSEQNAKWERGEIAMKFGYVDERMIAAVSPEAVGIAPVPLGPDGKTRGSEINCIMMGIFSGVKEPAVRDAAWEYMTYLTGPEAQRLRTRILVEAGFGRFVNPRYLDRFGYSEIRKLTPPGWMETFNLAIESGRPEPYGRNSNFLYQMMTPPIQRAEQLSVSDRLPENGPERRRVLKQLLSDANARADAVMNGRLSDAEKSRRRLAAGAALTVIAAGFALVLRSVRKLYAPAAPAKNDGRRETRKYLCAYLLLLPALLTILVWQYIPLARGSLMAFYDYKIIGSSTFVGLDNFAALLFDGRWWITLWDSLRYSCLTLALTFLPPVALAIGLQEAPCCRMLFRLLYYLPAVISGIVTMVLWKQFYEPSENGLLNRVVMNIPAIGFLGIGLLLFWLCREFARRLRFHGRRGPMLLFLGAGLLLLYTAASPALPILFPGGAAWPEALVQLPRRLFDCTREPYRWLADPSTAMAACVIPVLWAGIGPGCLIYLAALKGIPNDYYEAADVDGATFLDKILFIVFPMLKPLLIINFVGVFIGSWVGGTQMIMVMTGGSARTEVTGLYIWYEAFTFLRYGSATAMAWTLGVILIGFTVWQMKILARVEFKTSGR